MKTDYTIVSSYRNKDQVEYLVSEICKCGYTCFNFCDEPADPANPDAHPEVQMKIYEANNNFLNDEHFHKLFKRDIAGLKNAEQVILLQPCGLSAHMEAGIGFGLGKTLIMIGEPVKPETLYLIFKHRYSSIEEFIQAIQVK